MAISLSVTSAVSATSAADERGQTRLRVVVELALDATPEGVLGIARAAQQRAEISWTQYKLALDLHGTDYEWGPMYDTVPYVSLKVSPEALAALAASPRVRSIAGDRLVKTSLARSTQIIEADKAWARGLDGSGWAVAVLDTGVDGDHPHLLDKLIAEACFTSEDSCPNGSNQQIGSGAGQPCNYGGCEHGTHVAGIAAGGGPELSGVARGADIIAVQVFSRFDGDPFCPEGEACPLAFTSDLIRALEWVYKARSTHDIAAVNMSLGGGYYSGQFECDRENRGVKAAIDNLRSAGIATIVASGNEGYINGLGSPGCISSAISVGSTTKTNEISWFSNAAPFLNLLAPGSNIRSSIPGGDYASMSGTSMATPHVAGAWAVLKQRDPAASVGKILRRIKKTGEGIYDPPAKLTKLLVNVGDASRLGGPKVKVTSAILNGPEVARFDAGESVEITWKGDVSMASYDILYTLDGGKVWSSVAEGVTESRALWTIPTLAENASHCRVRVIGRDALGVEVNRDKNDRRFKILAPEEASLSAAR